MLYGILAFLLIVAAILMVVVVVVQNSKGGGINSAFGGMGGATQMLGARRSNEFIEKLTWYIAGTIAVLAFVTNVVGTAGMGEGAGDEKLKIEETLVAPTQAPTQAPDASKLPAEPAKEAEQK